MSKFIKLKNAETEKNVLIAASSIIATSELPNGGTSILLSTGDELEVRESFRTVSNRLTKGEPTEAEADATLDA